MAVITAEQMRAARALIRMEQAALAELSGVSLPTIKRLETTTGELRAQEATIDGIVSALKRSGVIFIDDSAEAPKGGVGVRLAEDASAQRWNEQVDTILSKAQDVLEKEIEVAEPPASDALTEVIERAFKEARRHFIIAIRDPRVKDMFEIEGDE